ncbi:metal-dependent hydrolase [Luteimonas gilva]|uniref:Metal-dependent hydrolase n=1 Tax=Luteimonas gilva TaxID=2572684 RepID=A0A4U5JUN3_9GAMM|nr:metal-dependent hydrolase [Luteimonas gilva]TKR33255.1 metal-dependent hydrolase [Luteimonas gilva]
MRSTDAGPGQLQPRRFLPEFACDTPRHWCGGDPALTHILNAYTLLVPGNEGYFIRGMKRALPLLADPCRRRLATEFMQQEGMHGAAHYRYWRVLENQGYRISGFRSRTDAFLYKTLEPMTPFKLRLSMIACVEHINAYIGHEFLAQRILEPAHPELRALFEWHFAEEIEHKHVTYDLLAAIAPGYALRLLGATMVLPMFYGLIGLGAICLLWQDRHLFKPGTWWALGRHLFWRDRMVWRTLKHCLAYLRPGFHPWQLDDAGLAAEVIARYSAPGSARLRETLATAEI